MVAHSIEIEYTRDLDASLASSSSENSSTSFEHRRRQMNPESSAPISISTVANKDTKIQPEQSQNVTVRISDQPVKLEQNGTKKGKDLNETLVSEEENLPAGETQQRRNVYSSMAVNGRRSHKPACRWTNEHRPPVRFAAKQEPNTSDITNVTGFYTQAYPNYNQVQLVDASYNPQLIPGSEAQHYSSYTISSCGSEQFQGLQHSYYNLMPFSYPTTQQTQHFIQPTLYTAALSGLPANQTQIYPTQLMHPQELVHLTTGTTIQQPMMQTLAIPVGRGSELQLSNFGANLQHHFLGQEPVTNRNYQSDLKFKTNELNVKLNSGEANQNLDEPDSKTKATSQLVAEESQNCDCQDRCGGASDPVDNRHLSNDPQQTADVASNDRASDTSRVYVNPADLDADRSTFADDNARDATNDDHNLASSDRGSHTLTSYQDQHIVKPLARPSTAPIQNAIDTSAILSSSCHGHDFTSTTYLQSDPDKQSQVKQQYSTSQTQSFSSSTSESILMLKDNDIEAKTDRGDKSDLQNKGSTENKVANDEFLVNDKINENPSDLEMDFRSQRKLKNSELTDSESSNINPESTEASLETESITLRQSVCRHKVNYRSQHKCHQVSRQAQGYPNNGPDRRSQANQIMSNDSYHMVQKQIMNQHNFFEQQPQFFIYPAIAQTIPQSPISLVPALPYYCAPPTVGSQFYDQTNAFCHSSIGNQNLQRVNDLHIDTGLYDRDQEYCEQESLNSPRVGQPYCCLSHQPIVGNRTCLSSGVRNPVLRPSIPYSINSPRSLDGLQISLIQQEHNPYAMSYQYPVLYNAPMFFDTNSCRQFQRYPMMDHLGPMPQELDSRSEHSFARSKASKDLIHMLPIDAVPTKTRQAYGMDKVWLDEFEQLFSQFPPNISWNLLEVECNPSIRDTDSIIGYKGRYLLTTERMDHKADDTVTIAEDKNESTDCFDSECRKPMSPVSSKTDTSNTNSDQSKGNSKTDIRDLSRKDSGLVSDIGLDSSSPSEGLQGQRESKETHVDSEDSDCDSGALADSTESGYSEGCNESPETCSELDSSISVDKVSPKATSSCGNERSFPTRFRMFIDSAKVRFSCDNCGHGWTSMKGRVVFWYELFQYVDDESSVGMATSSYDQIIGYCAYKLFGQQCEICKVEGRFERPMWYPEEVTKALGNLYNKVGQVYFGFKMPAIDKQRRAGKPKTSHNSSLCQACQDGVCTDRK